MNRVTHFEIQVDDVDRAIKFYSDVFGWEFPKWMEGYWGIMTAPKDSKEPGINGGLLKRPCPAPSVGQGLNAFVCTVVVDDFDQIAKKIEMAGGVVALPKMAIAGMAWQGYFIDTEGNIRVTRTYWKSLRKMYKVKSYDEQGDVFFHLEDENYKIDKDKGEEKKELWISEWWEGHKIGGAVVKTKVFTNKTSSYHPIDLSMSEVEHRKFLLKLA